MPGFIQDEELSADVFDVAPIIQGKTFSDPRIMRDAQESFDELSTEEKTKYLNGTDLAPYWSDPKLKDITSPVIRNYVDKNWESGVQKTIGSSKRKVAGSGSGFNWNIGIGSGNNKNNEFDVLPNQIFGNTKFDSFLNLGQVPNSAKTMTIQKFVDLETGEELDFNNSASFQTVGYSPDKDMVVVSLTKDASSNGVNLFSGKNIGLKGDQYDDFLKKKPFAIDRASLMVKNPEVKKKAKPTFLDWKKANPNGTVDQYLKL
jgi:hypothetical protein